MITSTGQIDSLQRTQEHKNTQPRTGDGFEGLFARELGQEQATQTRQPSLRADLSLVNTLQMDNAADASQNLREDATLQQVMTQVDGLLDNWDAYANQLSEGNPQLRNAYNVLQDMEQSLGQISSTMQNMKGQYPALNDTLNEIAVMTTTEKFKFNRGDYL